MVNLTSVFNPVIAEKVWQFAEVASFIWAGNSWLKALEKTNTLGASALSFIAAKSAYFATKGICHLANQPSSRGNLLGCIAGAVVAAAVQQKKAPAKEGPLDMMNFVKNSFSYNLASVAVQFGLGVAVRETSLRAIQWICSKTFMPKP